MPPDFDFDALPDVPQPPPQPTAAPVAAGGFDFDALPDTAASVVPAVEPAEVQPLGEEDVDPLSGAPLSLAAFHAQRGIPQDTVAKATEYGKALGISAESLIDDPASFKKAKEEVDFRESIKHLTGAPKLTALLAHNTALANVAREDLPQLSAIEAGVMDVAHWYYARKAMGGDKDAGIRLHDIDRMLAKYDKREHSIAAEVTKLLPGALEYGSAGVVGALLAGPGGAVAGPFIVMYQTQAGEMYARLQDAERAHVERDPTYSPLSQKEMEQFAKKSATFGATMQVLLGNVFTRSLPLVNSALQRLGVNIVATATEDTAIKAVLRRLQDTGAHGLSGSLAMAAQAVGDDVTVQKATTGQIDIGKATTAGVDTFKKVIVPMLLLSGAEQGRAYISDLGRVQQAPFDVGRVDQMAKMVKSSKMLERAPEAAEEILGAIIDGSDIDTSYIGHEALKDPNVAQAVADVVGEHAVAEALATQGEVVMPTVKYLLQVAPEFHDVVREHLWIDEDGASLTQAKETSNELRAILLPEPPARGELTRLMAERSWILQTEPASPERLAKLDRIAADMRNIAIRTPLPEESAGGKGVPQATLEALMQKYGGDFEKWANTMTPEIVNQSRKVIDPQPAKVQAPPESAFATMAREATEAKRLGDLQPGRHRRSAESAAKRAVDLGVSAVSGQVAGVEPTEAQSLTRLARLAEAEQARDYAKALEKAETEAKDEGEKNRKFLLRYTTDQGRSELGTASIEHRDAVDMLLSGFELGQGVSRPEVGRRLATMQWLASEEAAGRTPVLPDSVLNKLDDFVHWKELLPQEMRDLSDAVRSFTRQAELKNTIVSDRGRIAFDQAKSELIDGARANMKPVPIFQAGDVVPFKEKKAAVGRSIEAVILKPEEMIRRLDGGDINGPFGRHFWHPLSEAYNRFLVLEDKWSKPLLDAVEAVPKETRRGWKTKTFEVAGRERTMEQAIAVAMNQGNAGNAFKLLEGLKRGKTLGLTDWTQGTVDEFLSHVNRDGWNFVQATWDSLDSHWETIAKHEESLSGLAPKKVAHRGFDLWFDKEGNTVPAGTADAEKVHFRGGYYPVVYERQFNFLGRSGRGEGDLLSSNYRTATTPQGRLQSRIDNYARPVDLTLNALPGVIREFAKDVSMREALVSAHRLITDRDVANTLNQTLGEPNRVALQSMVLDAANDMVLPANGAEAFLKVANRMRGGVSASVFAWNIAQTTQNLAGVTQVMKHVPISYVREGMRAMILDPHGTIEFAKASSSEMATRAKHINAEMTEAVRAFQNKSVLGSAFETTIAPAQHIAELGLEVFQATDSFVANLGWRSAYEHAIAPVEKGGLGYDHQTAVRQAERTIRLAISSGRVLDLPSFLRHPVTKLLAPFSGWSNTQLNDYMATKYDARQLAADGDVWAARRKWALAHVWVAAGGIAGSLMVFKGPKDVQKDGLDVGDFARWLGIEGLLSPIWFTPYLGAPLKKLAEGEQLRSSLFTPTIGRPIETAIKAAIKIRSKAETKGLKSEDYEKFGLGMLEAVATMEGMPVVQAKNTLGYFLDPASPKNNPLQVTLGVAAGKTAPGKLLDLVK